MCHFQMYDDVQVRTRYVSVCEAWLWLLKTYDNDVYDDNDYNGVEYDDDDIGIIVMMCRSGCGVSVSVMPGYGS